MSETYRFEAEVNQVMRLVINSLYSNKEIFLRELVSNASDALDKLRFRSITEPELVSGDDALRVRITPDSEARTLTIEDNGVGMTHEELVKNLGTIAHSGSRQFLEQLERAAEQAEGADVSLIGQFGVGFYSAFLVADRVEVITQAAGAETAHRWASDAGETFEIGETERESGRGTSIILHLKDDQDAYLATWKLKELVRRYSDFVPHPVELPTTAGEDEEVTYEQANSASALWTRSASGVSDEEYEEFYKHLTHDWEAPLGRAHFAIEGMQSFRGLLFVPGQAPFDLYDPESSRGVRLYVKRVFIMEDCKEILPRWLRFVRGVVDSEDLPLNVSREILQDSRVARTMRKQVVKKTLSMLEGLDDDTYAKFWGLFGRVLKEGMHYDPTHAKQLSGLLRFETSTSTDPISLSEYVARMPEDQPGIYYALGPSRALLETSPHLEALRSRGYEIVYMVDPIDQFAVMNLPEFEDKKLISATGEDLELEDDEKSEEEKKEQAEKYTALTGHFTRVLEDRVQEVRVSDRLTESPVCLVVPEGGLNAHIERVLRANGQELPESRRILEVNPDHALIGHLQSLTNEERALDQVGEWIEVLYDQALLAEGSPLQDPAAFTKRITRLMEKAAFSTVVDA